MNGKNLLDKMSDVDPKLIADADKKPRHSRKLFIGITSGAATVAAAALIAVALGNNTYSPGGASYIESDSPTISVPAANSGIASGGTTSTQEPPIIDNTPKDPPKLDFSKYKDLPKISSGSYAVTGMGGKEYIGEKDGVVVYKDYFNYSDLEEGSPWKGAKLETMPVYMSHSTDLNIDLDKMYAIARNAAAALGIPEESLEFTDNFQRLEETIEANRKAGKEAGATDEEIEETINRIIRSVRSMTCVDAKNEDIRISVDAAYSIYVYFPDRSIKLPDGYNFTKSATDEEKAALVEYFAEEYKGLMNYSKPTLGRITADGFHIYDSDCDLTQQIVNYWINYACFDEHWENAGELSRMWFDSDGNCEKLGDYPILTPEQAAEILKSNKFDDEMRMPADAKILKTDIEYRNSAGSTGVLPYYKFYVETDKGDSNADVACLIYTMPAVPEEFIDLETTDFGVKA